MWNEKQLKYLCIQFKGSLMSLCHYWPKRETCEIHINADTGYKIVWLWIKATKCEIIFTLEMV